MCSATLARVSLALVTGASSGIGRATSLRLAASGWTVLAGVRDPAAGERLEADASAGSAGRLTAVSLDVTDPEQVAAAGERVAEQASAATRGSGLDALVNNAGVAVAGPLELVPEEDLRRQFEVNVLAQVAVTRALLPALRLARGRIAFVSSIGGRVAVPYNGPYAASKHALEALADALRVELRSSGVQVALIEPGSVATAIWDKGREEVERLRIPPELDEHYGRVPAAMLRMVELTAGRAAPPETVAAVIERALGARRMRTRYLVGADARGMLTVRRLLGDRLFDRVIARVLGV
jgi:NAD(P)-dependent dehydrogenase (short-subunit alcohol dehydrogenase family)